MIIREMDSGDNWKANDGPQFTEIPPNETELATNRHKQHKREIPVIDQDDQPGKNMGGGNQPFAFPLCLLCLFGADFLFWVICVICGCLTARTEFDTQPSSQTRQPSVASPPDSHPKL